MKDNSKFLSWLSDSQEDLLEVVVKNRKPHHKLSIEEIVSEINNYIIVKLEDLLEKNPDIDNEKDFKRFLQKVSVNFVKWTSQGGHSHKDQRYTKSKVDYTIKSDDGDQTAFEFICSQVGEEDPYFKSLNNSDKYDNLRKWILEYNHFLSDRQKNILFYILKGKSLDTIASGLGVTHQAVSALSLAAFDSIKQHIKLDTSNIDEFELLKEGNKAIQYLFGEERKKLRSKKV